MCAVLNFLLNMKIILVAITLCSVFYNCKAEEGTSLAELIEVVQPLTAHCEPKPERVHIEELISLKEDVKMETKCLRHCLFEQFEMVKQDIWPWRHLYYTLLKLETINLMQAQLLIYQIDAGQVIEEKAMEMLSMLYNERHDVLREIIKLCNQENSVIEEKCENAHGHAMCCKRELIARGFPMPEME